MPIDPTLYPPPRVQRGDWLDDVLLGRVQVGGYHDGPIPWPYRRRTGAHSLILTETLARMVRTEAARDVQEALGVSEGVVWRWRRALGVTARNNPGTQRLYRELLPHKLPPDVGARGREAAAQPEARERMRQTIRSGGRKPGYAIRWTPEMDALLGTLPDRAVAEQLGVSPLSVSARRAQLGIPPYRSRHRDISWTPEMDALLYTAPARELAERWGVSASAVKARRRRVGEHGAAED